MHMRATEIADWLRARIAAARAEGIVLRLTGDIGSAAAAGLARLASPGRVLGVILPDPEAPEDGERAKLIAEHFTLPAVRIDLQPAHDRLMPELTSALGILPWPPVPADDPSREGDAPPSAELMPRLRMSALYFFANALNYLVAGTADRCELTIGDFIKYGDGGVDVLPLGHLVTSEVHAIASDFGVPEAILTAGRPAAPRGAASDADGLGFTYADLERYLGEGPEGVAPAVALRIERLMRRTEHKRALPAVPTPPEERSLW